MRRGRGMGGQATVEMVALLPLLVLAGAAVFCVLAAGRAAAAADAAAQAGAMAALQGGDAAKAARASLGDWPSRAIEVRVDGTRVRVRLRPRLPVARLERRLAATAVADAGPASLTAPGEDVVRGGDGDSAKAAPDR